MEEPQLLALTQAIEMAPEIIGRQDIDAFRSLLAATDMRAEYLPQAPETLKSAMTNWALLAGRAGWTDGMKALLTHHDFHADMLLSPPDSLPKNQSPLSQACMGGHIDMVRLLLPHSSENQAFLALGHTLSYFSPNAQNIVQIATALLPHIPWWQTLNPIEQRLLYQFVVLAEFQPQKEALWGALFEYLNPLWFLNELKDQLPYGATTDQINRWDQLFSMVKPEHMAAFPDTVKEFVDFLSDPDNLIHAPLLRARLSREDINGNLPQPHTAPSFQRKL